jgi:hypothetical protein
VKCRVLCEINTIWLTTYAFHQWNMTLNVGLDAKFDMQNWNWIREKVEEARSMKSDDLRQIMRLPVEFSPGIELHCCKSCQPCSPYVKQGTCHFHLQERESRLLAASLFLTRLNVTHPEEDGGNTFLRNVGSCTDYSALYQRIWRL